MNMLEVNGLSAGYGSRKILEDISFCVEEHALVGILGANGSGKTTLLKALCGILPAQGQRMLNGVELSGIRPRKLAQMSRYISQRSGIDIDISARDVVLMGFNPQLRLLEYPTAAMKSAAEEALNRVGIWNLADENYQTLSEGQKQLCILARTLLLEAGVLFLDEPESALDFGGRYRMLELVRSWLPESRRGALVTLHDPQLALNCCDKLLLLKNGRLIDTVRPQTESASLCEKKLEQIYGALSIRRCADRSGKEQLILLKEAEMWKR